MNQAIEANIVRPELPEEADRVEQLLVRRRSVCHNLCRNTAKRSHKTTITTVLPSARFWKASIQYFRSELWYIYSDFLKLYPF